MTRFLSRIWNDPLCGSLNEETERLFAYHQATKHTFQSVRLNARGLDWRNQPNPFRIYEGAPVIVLPPGAEFPDIGTFAAIAALNSDSSKIAHESATREEVQLDLNWLSRFLWHSMAISAWKKVPGSENRYSLRVNPSSGNLHPTETHLAVRGFSDMGDGLYHYRADSHALELRSSTAATQQIARALRIPWANESPLIIGLTSIFWRESWKYGERAYRYCCHDLGHAMMNMLLAARALGLSGGVISHFGDAQLTRELGLADGDEAPMAFLAFRSKSFSHGTPLRPSEEFLGIPNELSAQEIPYELLLGIHCATILPDSADSLLDPRSKATGEQQLSPLAAAAFDAALDAPLGAVVRRRRSALDFDARTSPMDRKHLEQLLDFATRDWPADWRGNFRGPIVRPATGTDFIALYLYVHRIADCEAGVYRWDAGSRSLEQLHPGNVQRVAAYLSLEQELAGNSCFTISMIANLAKAVEVFGNRGYRYVHFEAGAIGQRLYIGAEALNWNATGIGAFYDDDVHRYLGFLQETENRADTTLPEDSRFLPQQVIYHFAVGRAIPDPRLNG